jgi:hypothetical protein
MRCDEVSYRKKLCIPMDAIMVGENAAVKLIESNRITSRFIFRCLYVCLKKKTPWALWLLHSVFYVYKLIGKLTASLQLQTFSLRIMTVGNVITTARRSPPS